MSKKILIVDDSLSIRQVVGLTLRGAGYTVMEASDGVEALSKLNGERVNLVISDVNMPNMDGISLLQELKKSPIYKFIPVIMLTTEGADEKKKLGQQAGAKAWVVKPFKPEQLIQAVNMLVA